MPGRLATQRAAQIISMSSISVCSKYVRQLQCPGYLATDNLNKRGISVEVKGKTMWSMFLRNMESDTAATLSVSSEDNVIF